MDSSSSSLMATRKTKDEWEAVRDEVTLLYRSMTLEDVMSLMERERNFYASMRQYKERIKAWGVSKYKKREKKGPLRTEDTAVSDNLSSAVSSEGDTCDPADLSIPPSAKNTGQRRVRGPRMPRINRPDEFDARHLVPLCDEQVSTFTTTSSNPEPSRSPITPIQGFGPEYFHGDLFDSSASVPKLAVLPVFVSSHDELETMGVTMTAKDGSGRAELASQRLTERDAGESFGSSIISSGTIDSNPQSAYDLMEGGYMSELIEYSSTNHRTSNFRRSHVPHHLRHIP